MYHFSSLSAIDYIDILCTICRTSFGSVKLLAMAKNVRRLAAQFRPDHYVLELVPDKAKMRFSGVVIVTGHKSGKPSRRITLHQSGLKITKAHLTKHDKKDDLTIEIDRINHHKSYEEVRLHSSKLLYPGRYTITLDFEGQITRVMSGMYPCFFKHQGKEKKLIATQFESHHAREVFPCIDEPEAKATFDLTMVTPKDETVIANTPIKKQVTSGKKQVTIFETTPKMSTYLLAFVYGEVGFKEARTADGVVVRTYATPDNVEFTDFALDVAVKCLEFYNNYFGIPYPLKKCDLIALPDFASGAMENWGCITFREQSLLVDPANTSLANKQYVAMVIAHELAHQWFGNLVTMRWWTDLWLNEGFASWIEYLAVDHIFPDWQMWTQFIVGEQQQAMKLDALEHTHPIEVEVKHPDEIRTIFDAISYSKGSSVIHMLHGYLGPKMFQEGLSFYLQQHAYSNTDTVDLWSALEETSGRPVRKFMHDWTSQPGFPIIHANINEEGVDLSQERFFFNPKARTNLKSPIWPVPLLAHEAEMPDILHAPKLQGKLPANAHFKLNRHQGGFYRVLYNASYQQRLKELVQRGQLEAQDRMGLLNDSFEAAKAGYGDTAEALNLLQVFTTEDNAAVWEIIASDLGSVRAVMDDEELREAMKPFVRKLTAKQIDRLGWRPRTKESHFDTLLRPTVLGMAAAADDPDVVKECWRQFRAMHRPEDIDADLRSVPDAPSVRRGMDVDPDLRGVVYGTVARLGGESEFEKLLGMHNRTTHSEQRITIAAALTGFKQPELIKRALEFICSPKIRAQDIAYWVAYSFMNRHAKYETWEWLKNNWEWLSKTLGEDLSFYRFPIYAARAFSNEEFLKEYKDFFEPKRGPAIDRSINQGIEIIEWQSAWKKRDFKEVMAFFKAHQ